MTTAATLRLIARILSLGLIVLFLAMLIGEGLPDFSELTAIEIAGFVAVGTMMAGVLVAFRRVLTGSVLIVVGYAWLCILDGVLHIDSPFVAFPLIALLYLVAQRRRPSV